MLTWCVSSWAVIVVACLCCCLVWCHSVFPLLQRFLFDCRVRCWWWVWSEISVAISTAALAALLPLHRVTLAVPVFMLSILLSFVSSCGMPFAWLLGHICWDNLWHCGTGSSCYGMLHDQCIPSIKLVVRFHWHFKVHCCLLGLSVVSSQFRRWVFTTTICCVKVSIVVHSYEHTPFGTFVVSCCRSTCHWMYRCCLDESDLHFHVAVSAAGVSWSWLLVGGGGCWYCCWFHLSCTA